MGGHEPMGEKSVIFSGNQEKDLEKQLKEIEKHNFKLTLIPKQRFEVVNVLGTTTTIYDNNHNPITDHFKLAGTKSLPTLKMEVKPYNKSIPVKSIIFQGKDTPVKAGDTIDVLIPLLKDNKHRISDHEYGLRTIPPKYLKKQEYLSNENAIEISILDNKKNILRTDRAVSYDQYNNLKESDFKSKEDNSLM